LSGSGNPGIAPSRPQDRRAPARDPDRRSDALLPVARGLLRRGGLAGLTMARIAEEAGCSRPAVYQYFRNKEEVVAALAIESARLRNRFYQRVPSFAGRSRERLVALAEVDAILYPDWLVLEETTYANALRARTGPARQEDLRRVQRIAYESHLAVVREAIVAGDLELAHGASPEQLVSTLANFSTGLFAPVSSGLPDLEGEGLDPRAAMHRLGSAFLDGLRWRPLAADWDYRETLRRVYVELFPPDFLEQLGLPSSRSINQARRPQGRRPADPAQE
jgi:AcrR family transcriptional regulator